MYIIFALILIPLYFELTCLSLNTSFSRVQVIFNYFTVLVVSTSGTSNEAESTDIESTCTDVESTVDTEAGVSTFLQLVTTKAIKANAKITFFIFVFVLLLLINI
jgi:hypothetical protein